MLSPSSVPHENTETSQPSRSRVQGEHSLQTLFLLAPWPWTSQLLGLWTRTTVRLSPLVYCSFQQQWGQGGAISGPFEHNSLLLQWLSVRSLRNSLCLSHMSLLSYTQSSSVNTDMMPGLFTSEETVWSVMPAVWEPRESEVSLQDC